MKMGAVVYLKQYFNAAGILAYPALLERHRSWAAHHEGFIALRSWTQIDPANAETSANSGEVELTVEFSTLDDLMKWRASEEHAQVAHDYGVHWIKDPELHFYVVSD
jgi:heme-degrading monooxygenase HmoA